jgi:hypothetical protein
MEFEIFSIHEKGWTGKSNGELLQLLINDGFDLLLTFDKNLQFQQNLNKLKITVIVINASDNSYSVLQNLVLKIKLLLSEAMQPGVIQIKE